MVQEESSSVLLTGFALDSQSGVAGVLRAIRKSEADSRTKNDLRNLVLQYTSSGGDQGLRTALEASLQAAGISEATTPQTDQLANKKTTTSTFGFAGARPQPVISFSQAKAAAEPVVKAKPEPTLEKETVSIKPASEQEVPARAVTTTDDGQDTPTSTVVPVREASEAVISDEAISPASSAAVGKQEEVAQSAATIMSSGSTEPSPRPVSPDFNFDNYLNRIKEIKNEINLQYGSPVGIVNIDADLGHEYMAALLNAMKELSIESSGSVQAMDRLETIFAKVKALSDSKTSAEITSKPSPVSRTADSAPDKKTAATAPDAQTNEAPLINRTPQRAVIPPRPVAKTVIPASQNEVPNSLHSPSPDVDKVSINVDHGRFIDRSPQTDEVANSFRDDAARNSVKVTPRTTATRSSLQDRLRDLETGQDIGSREPGVGSETLMTSTKTDKQITPNIISTPTSLNNSSQVKSVIEDSAPLKTLRDLPSAAEVAAANSGGDPLFSAEVNQGLDQLLSEWVLFKKSGLFGSGPKGVHHPLFKKLANIQVPLLLAGRFEGATQEIRQSITDYMNGWRYEQGIVYEKGETFEQYLRRVIRHIIDLQK